jgi:hypothetical protein
MPCASTCSTAPLRWTRLALAAGDLANRHGPGRARCMERAGNHHEGPGPWRLRIIVPLVNTAEEAAMAVAACRYRPVGMGSSGPRARNALRRRRLRAHANDEIAFVKAGEVVSARILHRAGLLFRTEGRRLPSRARSPEQGLPPVLVGIHVSQERRENQSVEEEAGAVPGTYARDANEAWRHARPSLRIYSRSTQVVTACDEHPSSVDALG